MTQHERYTYTQGREVIEHAIGYLKQVRDHLDDARAGEHPERVRMLLDSMETEQRNLLGAMERFLEDAPDKALDTYEQYTVELPPRVEAPETPLTNLKLFQWLQSHNANLFNLFNELAEKGDKHELAELFGGMAQHVESHERRLSKEYQRFEDL